MKSKLAALAIVTLSAVSAIFPLRVTGQAATPASVPAVLGTPLYQGVPEGASIPRVVPELCTPKPLQENVSASLREIRITFDQPMDTALFYWPIPTNDPYFPFVRSDPYWTNANKTIVIPVQLAANRIYSIPINSPTMVFRGATGLYANPGLFRFSTTSGGSGGVIPNSVANPNRNSGSFGPVVPTAAPVQSPFTGSGTGAATIGQPGTGTGTGAVGGGAAGISTGTGRPNGNAFRRPTGGGVMNTNSALQQRRATPTPVR